MEPSRALPCYCKLTRLCCFLLVEGLGLRLSRPPPRYGGACDAPFSWYTEQEETIIASCCTRDLVDNVDRALLLRAAVFSNEVGHTLQVDQLNHGCDCEMSEKCEGDKG